MSDRAPSSNCHQRGQLLVASVPMKEAKSWPLQDRGMVNPGHRTDSGVACSCPLLPGFNPAFLKTLHSSHTSKSEFACQEKLKGHTSSFESSCYCSNTLLTIEAAAVYSTVITKAAVTIYTRLSVRVLLR